MGLHYTIFNCIFLLISTGTTFDELTEAMKDAVLEEHIRPFGSLDMAVKFSLEVGSNLGIITLSDETVPMPFNFRDRKPSPTLRITAAQGRKVIKKALAKPKTRAAKPRPKPKSKAKACAGKRPVQKVASGKQRLSCKVSRPRGTKTRKLTKPKQKKRA